MVPDDTQKDTTSSDISRRRALQLAAGGSALALAGCSGSGGGGNQGGNGGNGGNGGSGGNGGGGGNQGGNGGGDTGPSESGSTQMTDKTFVTYITDVPTDIQFNPLSTAATDFYTKGAVYAWTAQVSSSASPPQYMPMVAKNWEVNGKTFTIELNDSFTWHDGKSLTAEDLSLQYNLDRFMGAGKYYGVWDFADSVEATGEYTVEMALKEEVNPSLIVGEALGEPIAYEPKTHGKFLDRFRNASSESEKEQIRKEVTELTIKEPVGAGPVKFVSADAQKMVFEPYQKFPFKQVQQQFSDASGADITGWPDQLNFSQVNFKYVPTDRLTQEIRSGGVDAGRATSSITQLPPNYEKVAIPGLYGWSLLFNFWDSGLDAWEDPNVRKAFAHVLDRKAMAVQFMNEEAKPDKLITGMTTSQEDQWLSSSFKNKLDPYELNPQKATRYLEQSDYTKQNGKWMNPDGEPFVVKLKTASDVTNYVNGLQVAASNLTQFGIETNFQTEESTTYFSKEGNEQGYQIEAGPDYGGSGPDPYGAFDFIYRKEYIQMADSGESDYYLPGDETLEVPPVGQPNSNERVTIDPYATLTELGKATDEKTQTKLVEELAWATNQGVPMITVTEAILEGFLHTDGWEYPPVDSPPVNMKSAAFTSLMLQSGIIKATQ